MSKERILYLVGFLLISSAYLITSIWLQSRGFFNPESYFIEYKTQILLRFDTGFLRTFYFTRPALLFLLALPFSLLFTIHGTFILNAILIGLLTNHLISKGLKGDRDQKIYIVYLLLSPVILYAGVSGGSLALYLAFYFLFFNLLLKYNSSQSVYHLTLLSLLLGAHVLMDAQFVKLILLLIPVFFFVGFYKTKGISGNFYYRASVIFKNSSQRRKFFTGFLSAVMVVSFIPGMSFLIYLVINKVFAGEYFFFQTSVGDSYSSYSQLFPLINSGEELWNGISSPSLTFIVAIAFLSPLLVYKLFGYADTKGTKITLTLALLFILAEVSSNKIVNINLTQLSLPIGAGLAALYTRPEEEIHTSRRRLLVPLIFGLISLFLEVTYFQHTLVKNERLFINALTNAESDSDLTSIEQIQFALAKLPKGRVLADDAIFYPELSLLEDGFSWEGHFSSAYLYALQKPDEYADYVIVTKENHPMHLNDIVATAIKRTDFFKTKLQRKILYENDSVMLLELKK